MTNNRRSKLIGTDLTRITKYPNNWVLLEKRVICEIRALWFVWFQCDSFKSVHWNHFANLCSSSVWYYSVMANFAPSNWEQFFCWTNMYVTKKLMWLFVCGNLKKCYKLKININIRFILKKPKEMCYIFL